MEDQKKTVVAAARHLLDEIDDLYLSGILEAPEEDDPEDPRIPLMEAREALRVALEQ